MRAYAQSKLLVSHVLGAQNTITEGYMNALKKVIVRIKYGSFRLFKRI